MVSIRKNIAISDSGFVFDPLSGDSFSLNPVGLEIIQHIKSGKPYAEIARAMTDKYDVGPETFERYYYDFIATLKQLRLLTEQGKDEEIDHRSFGP